MANSDLTVPCITQDNNLPIPAVSVTPSPSRPRPPPLSPAFLPAFPTAVAAASLVYQPRVLPNSTRPSIHPHTAHRGAATPTAHGIHAPRRPQSPAGCHSRRLDRLGHRRRQRPRTSHRVTRVTPPLIVPVTRITSDLGVRAASTPPPAPSPAAVTPDKPSPAVARSRRSLPRRRRSRVTHRQSRCPSIARCPVPCAWVSTLCSSVYMRCNVRGG